jgi:hypothetical protein
MDIEYSNNCRQCGTFVEPSHGCPYAEDVNGDYEFQCNCCESCTSLCADEI